MGRRLLAWEGRGSRGVGRGPGLSVGKGSDEPRAPAALMVPPGLAVGCVRGSRRGRLVTPPARPLLQARRSPRWRCPLLPRPPFPGPRPYLAFLLPQPVSVPACPAGRSRRRPAAFSVVGAQKKLQINFCHSDACSFSTGKY